jgi:Spy/CpxP family protein refolding chaperone
MKIRRVLLAIAFLGFAAPLHAQGDPSPAAILLSERSQLNLTAEQERKLRDLDHHYMTQVRPVEERMARSRAAERRLSAVKSPTASQREELRTEQARVRKERSEIASMRRTNREEAMRVLTPAQRTKAEEIMKHKVSKHRKTHPTKKHTPSGGMR